MNPSKRKDFKFKIGDSVYAFMNIDNKKAERFKRQNLLYLARGKVLDILVEQNLYLIDVEEILYDATRLFNNGKSLFPIGKQTFAKFWIEEGERAFKIFDNPSTRESVQAKLRVMAH
jgi:hypothetical protein